MKIYSKLKMLLACGVFFSLSAACENAHLKMQDTNKAHAAHTSHAEDIARNIKQSTPTSPVIPFGLDTKLDIRYQGAFRALAKGVSSSDYAIGTLGYNADNKSIFMAGHDHHKAIAEFEIPNKLSFATSPSEIIEAKVLQDYVSVLDRHEVGSATDRITGLLYYHKRLLINSEIWYDASAQNRDNMQVVENANDLASSHFKGMLQLDGAAKVAGYMSAIPKDVQDKLGGKYLVGWASNYSITSRYSQGPSLYVFDPKDAINANLANRKISTTPKMVFPLERGKTLVEEGDKFQDEVSPIWGAQANARYGFIIPNSNIFMAIGFNGGLHSGIGYKITQDSGQLCGGGCTKEANDGYNYFWLFDIDEIVNATSTHNIKPFSYGKWSHPYDEGGNHKIIGGTFDPDNNRLFLSLKDAGRTSQYDRPPLILSYKITAK